MVMPSVTIYKIEGRRVFAIVGYGRTGRETDDPESVRGSSRLGHKGAVQMFDPPLASLELVEEAERAWTSVFLCVLGSVSAIVHVPTRLAVLQPDPDRARVDFCNGPRKEEVIEIVADFRMRGSRFVAYGR